MAEKYVFLLSEAFFSSQLCNVKQLHVFQSFQLTIRYFHKAFTFIVEARKQNVLVVKILRLCSLFASRFLVGFEKRECSERNKVFFCVLNCSNLFTRTFLTQLDLFSRIIAETSSNSQFELLLTEVLFPLQASNQEFFIFISGVGVPPLNEQRVMPRTLA